MLRLILVVSLLQAVASPVHAGDASPGLWRITLNMTAAGMDNELGPYTRTQCLTQADVQNPEMLFAEMGGSCTFADKHYHANHFTFFVQCIGVVPMQGEGDVSFGPESFEGNLSIQAEVPDMGLLKTKSRMTGSRLGDCQKIPQ